MRKEAFNKYAPSPRLLSWLPNTYRYFKLCERGHVYDTHGFLTALDLGLHNVKPIWLIESLALLQCQEVYRTEQQKGERKGGDVITLGVRGVSLYSLI